MTDDLTAMPPRLPIAPKRRHGASGSPVQGGTAAIGDTQSEKERNSLSISRRPLMKTIVLAAAALATLLAVAPAQAASFSFGELPQYFNDQGDQVPAFPRNRFVRTAHSH